MDILEKNGMLQNRFANPYIFVVVLVSFCPPVWAENFFKLEPIEYFQIIKKKDEKVHSFDWRTPMFNADGKVSFYEPPAPVLNLLNEPSLMNAKLYIAWQEEKMDKIKKAQQVIETIVKDGEH